MPLAFTDRVRLALATAEKKPAAVTPKPPLSPGDEVTEYDIALASQDLSVTVSVTRGDDKAGVAFLANPGGALIDSGVIHRHQPEWAQVERIRAQANKVTPPPQDGGLGAKLDALLQS